MFLCKNTAAAWVDGELNEHEMIAQSNCLTITPLTFEDWEN